ncbi:MAG: DUF1667 domain-containing protein [Lachnospiraceae bacterium]|nr:DUF1667 domain-containing protein [Lachnospiraceae bacterium]
METRTLTCIGCPMGCTLTVETEEGRILTVSGNTCPKGDAYARRELTAPMRMVTSTVRLTGSDLAMLPVRTAREVPKEAIFACMASLNGVVVEAPVRTGDIVVPDAGGTGVPFVAARDAAGK